MKIAALEGFKSFEQLEEEGVWCTIAQGVEWKIRRMRSKAVERAKDRIYGPHERAMRGKDLPDQLETELTKRLLSQAVVVDWRGPGMVDDSGVAIPFSSDACFEILSDPDTGKDLRGTIIAFAMDASVFTPETDEVKGDEGN